MITGNDNCFIFHNIKREIVADLAVNYLPTCIQGNVFCRHYICFSPFGSIEVSCVPTKEIIVALNRGRKDWKFSRNQRHRGNFQTTIDIKGNGICALLKSQSCRFCIYCRCGIRISNNCRSRITGNRIICNCNYTIRNANRDNRSIRCTYKCICRYTSHNRSVYFFRNDYCTIRAYILSNDQAIGTLFNCKITIPFQIETKVTRWHSISSKIPRFRTCTISIPSSISSVFAFKACVLYQQISRCNHRGEQYFISVIERNNILVITQAIIICICFSSTISIRAENCEEGTCWERCFSNFDY